MVLLSMTSFALGLLLHNVDLSAAPGAAVSSMPLSDIAVMIFCAGAVFYDATRIGLFGAPILGPMALSDTASLAGLIENRPRPRRWCWRSSSSGSASG